MYDYNFPKALTQERLTLLLLSIVIPTDTAVLKDIYKKKRELEDKDYSYRYNRTTNGYWDGKKWHKYDAITRGKYMKIVSEYSKSLIMIGCLYPNFIMYANGEDWEFPGITYSRVYNLYPLKEMIQEYPLKNAVSVLNYIVDNWEIAHNDYLNNSNGWRIKPSIVDYTGYIVFDILDGLLSDFKSKIQDVNSMEQLVDLVEDTGILYDECGFINF